MTFRERQVDCNTSPCPTWSDWVATSTCSATCNGGTQTESSTCFYEGVESTMCEGNAICMNGNDYVNNQTFSQSLENLYPATSGFEKKIFT